MRKTKILAELNSYPERIKILEQQSKEYDMLLDSYKKRNACRPTIYYQLHHYAKK